MESEKADHLAYAERGSAPARISVDWVSLLTGLVGAIFLIGFWMLLITSAFFVAALVYFLVVGALFQTYVASGLLVTMLLLCGFLYWTAGGILRGRRFPAVVACIGMLIFAGAVIVFLAESVQRGFGTWEETSGTLIPASLNPVLVALLLASFCKRGYWRKNL